MRLSLKRATLEAALNYCHVLIFLNQTSSAREILGPVETYALKTNKKTYSFKARYLLALADARIHSLSRYHDVSNSEANSRGQTEKPFFSP